MTSSVWVQHTEAIKSAQNAGTRHAPLPKFDPEQGPEGPPASTGALVSSSPKNPAARKNHLCFLMKPSFDDKIGARLHNSSKPGQSPESSILCYAFRTTKRGLLGITLGLRPVHFHDYG
jgi:hypothetical protein